MTFFFFKNNINRRARFLLTAKLRILVRERQETDRFITRTQTPLRFVFGNFNAKARALALKRFSYSWDIVKPKLKVFALAERFLKHDFDVFKYKAPETGGAVGQEFLGRVDVRASALPWRFKWINQRFLLRSFQILTVVQFLLRFMFGVTLIALLFTIANFWFWGVSTASWHLGFLDFVVFFITSLLPYWGSWVLTCFPVALELNLLFFNFSIPDFFNIFTGFSKIVFRSWEGHLIGAELSIRSEVLKSSSFFFLLLLIYCVTFISLMKTLFSAFFLRFDPWSVLVKLFYGVNFLRALPDVSEARQVIGLNPFTKSNEILRMLGANSNSLSKNQKRFLFNYNINTAFGGFVGFIDFFPSFDTKLNKASSKRRLAPKHLFRHFVLFLNQLKFQTKKLNLNSSRFFWRRAPYRFNYFSVKNTLNPYPLINPNLYTVPRFRFPFFKSLFLQVSSALFSAVSAIGDLEVTRLREKIFYYNTWNAFDEDVEPFQKITEDLPFAELIVGNLIDFYQRELNTVILARTVTGKITKESGRLFKLGLPSSVNPFSFWKPSADLEDHTDFFLTENLDKLYNKADSVGGGVAPELFNFFSQKGRFDALEGRGYAHLAFHDDPEMQEKEDAWFFEDGFLHEDFESPIFDEEPFESTENGVSMLRGNSDDDEILDFLSHPLFAYGAGQENDYLRALRKPARAARMEYLVSGLKLNPQSATSFYDDVADFYWLNTAHLSFNNFLEQPYARFFNVNFRKTRALKRFKFFTRIRSGALVSFFSPFLHFFVLPKFTTVWGDIFKAVFVAFAVFNYFLFFFFGPSSALAENTLLSALALACLQIFFIAGAIFFYLLFECKPLGFAIFNSWYSAVLKIIFAFLQVLPFAAYFADIHKMPYKRLWVSESPNFSLRQVKESPASTRRWFKYRISYVIQNNQKYRFWFLLQQQLFAFKSISVLPKRFWWVEVANFSKFFSNTRLHSLTKRLDLGSSVLSSPYLNLLQLNSKHASNSYAPLSEVSNATFFIPQVKTFDVKTIFFYSSLSDLRLYGLKHLILNFNKFDTFFETKLRLVTKRNLVSGLNLDTDESLLNKQTALPITSLKKTFSKTSLFYSILDRRGYALTGVAKLNPAQGKTWVSVADIITSDPSSTFSQRYPPAAQIRRKNFKFFSLQLFGTENIAGSRPYINALRLLLSEDYVSKLYASRFSKERTVAPTEHVWLSNLFLNKKL